MVFQLSVESKSPSLGFYVTSLCEWLTLVEPLGNRNRNQNESSVTDNFQRPGVMKRGQWTWVFLNFLTQQLTLSVQAASFLRFLVREHALIWNTAIARWRGRWRGLHEITSNSNWVTGLSLCLLIGRSNCFRSGFDDTNL